MFTYLCTDSSNWIWFSGVASFYKWWLKLGTKVGRLQILNFCPLWICLIWYNTSCWCYTLCWVSKNMNTHTYIHAYICVCIYIYIYCSFFSKPILFQVKGSCSGKKKILELQHFHELAPRTKILVIYRPYIAYWEAWKWYQVVIYQADNILEKIAPIFSFNRL